LNVFFKKEHIMVVALQDPVRAHSQFTNRDASVRSRVETLLRTEIAFIPNPEFAGEVRRDLAAESSFAARQSGGAPKDLPPHLRRLCESDLLTHEQESWLFREMNLLKYQANAIRCQLDPATADIQEVLAVETLLKRAEGIRDHIIQANMRLVMSIVKKFVTPQQAFDDMLSDGIFTLMQAVEKFDFDRGFRFSTYAYRSIARNAYRTVTTARQHEARFTRDAEQWAFEQEDDHSASSLSDQVWSNLRNLTTSMLDQLDRRERFIVRSRYALGAHRKVRTFQFLADKLGVSKERVRQLEQRAVAKLRNMAAEHDVDELFGAAMA